MSEWAKLRTFQGSQQTAFEELCCQLARRDPVPAGARFTRKGAPDAGVECYWLLSDGTEHAWQAKFFLSVPGPAQWRQLKESFSTAVGKHLRMTRYIVCVPLDRADPRVEGQTSFAEKWDEFAVWCAGQAAGRTIKVEYWGNSEIFDRLSRQENQGRYQFWFNSERFTTEWFRQRLDEAVANAGDRYSPTLNIDLPIGRAIDGLGRTERFWRRFTQRAVRLRNKWSERLPRWKLPGEGEAYAALMAEINRLDPDPATHLDFVRMEGAIRTARNALVPAWEEVRRMHAEEEKVEEKDKHTHSSPSSDLRRALYEVEDALDELLGFVTGPEGRTADSNAALVTGRAGAGKTHLFCDAALHRLKEDQPSLLLLGEGIQTGEAWMQVIRNLGLTISRDEFLGALDAAAEASGCRLILFMDALNEGAGLEVWRDQLAGFLTALRPFPSVVVALSVRDLYESRVIPAQLDEARLPRVEHEGFEEKTEEATRRFFQHFEIALPDHPILNPEFGTPLFLKLFCTALRRRQVKVVPKGLSGITSIFSFFLSATNEKLAERLDYDSAQDEVGRAVRELSNAMARSGADWVPLEEARMILGQILPTTGYQRSLLHQLCSEGILQRSFLRDWDTDAKTEIVRFAYQRLSDHMIVAAILAQSVDGQGRPDLGENSALGRLLRTDSYWQLSSWFEALAIQLPERFGLELSDVDHPLDAELEEKAFLASLLWRGPTTHLPRTKELVEARLADEDTRPGVLHALLLVAAQPDHPFNANFVHAKLAAMSMPERDRWWTIPMSHDHNHAGRVPEIIGWAWAERDRSGISEEAIELYGTTLAWFLTLPQRFLRDRATKAMVSLFEGREKVLLRILEKFKDVNDPYVAERLYAVAHGVALRSQDDEAAEQLAEWVYDRVFAAGTPPPSVLLRMHAAGAVEAVIARGGLPRIDRKELYPPFQSAWSDDVPSIEELRKAFKDEVYVEGAWGLGRIFNSVTIDDFSHYVIGNSIEWSHHRLGRPVPPSTKAKFARLEKRFPRLTIIAKRMAKVQIFLRLAGSDHGRKTAGDQGLTEHLEKAPEYLNALEADVRELLAGPRDHKHVDWVLKHLEDPTRSNWENEFGHERIRRHILQNVLKLGYRDDWFSKYDDNVPSDGRSAHKSERIGKKYQWIAYHEVIARISDNFRFLKDAGKYELRGWTDGLWQNAYRNIDPSLLIQSDRQDDDDEVPVRGREWWLGQTYDAWASREQDFAWLQSSADQPPVQELVRVKDPEDGSLWLNLNSFVKDKQVERLGSLEQRKPERREVFRFLYSYFVPRKNAARLMAWARQVNFSGRWMPEPAEYHRFPLHEFFGGRQFARDRVWARDIREKVPVPIASTGAAYLCEASTFDCSISAAVSIQLPAKMLVEKLGLRMKGRLGRFYDAANQLVAYDPAAGTDGTHGLLFRESAMIDFLKQNELVLVWVLNGEKNIYPDDLSMNRKHWLGRLEFSGAFQYAPSAITGQVNTNFIPGEGAPKGMTRSKGKLRR